MCRCYGVSGSCSTKMCMRKLPPFEEVAAELKRQYWRAVMVANEFVRQAPYQAPAQMGGGRYYGNSRARGGRQGQPRRAEEPSALLVRRDRGRSLAPIGDHEFVYSESSSSYCNAEPRRGVLGTRDRTCRRSPPPPEPSAQLQQLTQPAYRAQLPPQYYGGSAGGDQYASRQSAYSGVALRTMDQPEDRDLDFFEGSCDELCCGRGYSTFTEQRREQCHCKFIWCCEVQCQQCLTTEEKYTCN